MKVAVRNVLKFAYARGVLSRKHSLDFHDNPSVSQLTRVQSENLTGMTMYSFLKFF